MRQVEAGFWCATVEACLISLNLWGPWEEGRISEPELDSGLPCQSWMNRVAVKGLGSVLRSVTSVVTAIAVSVLTMMPAGPPFSVDLALCSMTSLATNSKAALVYDILLGGRCRKAVLGVWRKLQALVYDILPSTTAVFSYAIGPRKLSANEQFFVDAQTVVSLLQTTQIISDVCFITDHVAYAS